MAVLPVLFELTELGEAVMVGAGLAFTVTLAVPVFEQVPLPTVRVSPTGPLEPAV